GFGETFGIPLWPPPAAPQWSAHLEVNARAGRVSTLRERRLCGADTEDGATRAGPTDRQTLPRARYAHIPAFQCGYLSCGFLFVGGNPSVTDQHCVNVSPVIFRKATNTLWAENTDPRFLLKIRELPPVTRMIAATLFRASALKVLDAKTLRGRRADGGSVATSRVS